MNEDNRVLGRKNARELTPHEVAIVNGAFVFTFCTFRPPPFGDADCIP